MEKFVVKTMHFRFKIYYKLFLMLISFLSSFVWRFLGRVTRAVQESFLARKLVFTSDGVGVGCMVVIRSEERYDLVKFKPTESYAEFPIPLTTVSADPVGLASTKEVLGEPES